MTTLLLPVSGKSSRFPGMRPKWLLTMPNGKLMIEESISYLNMSDFKKIIIICLKEHVDEYLGKNGLRSIANSIPHQNISFCILSKPTKSQSETIYQAIIKKKISGSIFIKDCDNNFKIRSRGENEVSVLDLNTIDLVDAKNKSYVQIDGRKNITNIVEKQVISNYFCCGGYGFSDAKLFQKHYKSINSEKEIYISHVIYRMIVSGINFKITNASKYNDWGTLREYRDYTRSFLTIFCDVDGVLLSNGSKFGKNGWSTKPIIENLMILSRLQADKKLYLVITSSRPQSEIPYISKQIAKYGVKANKFIMGLPHTCRVLVNDYSNSNPYPSAISINIERDSATFSKLMDTIIN